VRLLIGVRRADSLLPTACSDSFRAGPCQALSAEGMWGGRELGRVLQEAIGGAQEAEGAEGGRAESRAPKRTRKLGAHLPMVHELVQELTHICRLHLGANTNLSVVGSRALGWWEPQVSARAATSRAVGHEGHEGHEGCGEAREREREERDVDLVLDFDPVSSRQEALRLLATLASVLSGPACPSSSTGEDAGVRTKSPGAGWQRGKRAGERRFHVMLVPSRVPILRFRHLPSQIAGDISGAYACLPSPTLSPTDPVPRGLLTLCPAASSGPQGLYTAYIRYPSSLVRIVRMPASQSLSRSSFSLARSLFPSPFLSPPLLLPFSLSLPGTLNHLSLPGTLNHLSLPVTHLTPHTSHLTPHHFTPHRLSLPVALSRSPLPVHLAEGT